MQIGSGTSYVLPTPVSTSARPLSADVSPDLIRSDLAPASPAQQAPRDASTSARKEQGERSSSDKSEQELRQEALEISDLAQRDREVRTHEQAHAAVGGQHAGSPTYRFERGPDGQRYAVSGEVGIDASAIPGDPEATLQKMEIVRRAALAPAEPSAQDLSVAAMAQAQAAQARAELAQVRADEQGSQESAATDETDQSGADSTAQQAAAPPPNLDLYRRMGDLQEPVSLIDQVA
ncbi:conserved hypothetical protein [Pseudomonas sp. 8Z]|uniref:putative metalloprotease CJM1_0395 family protein n=1 Tax=Pseudomonas sp. 8Z TaxID=2653166 RepID=UPI0012EF9563|nr:putative metalloprotease CJM1_0395 family protein [Pseudomonas sp. 8Z]VXC98473.1 conserved hypothetical protein [Pseudomonas sp. 8Z]